MVALTVLMTALLGMAALAIDVSRLYVARQRLQDAADMAALAASQELPATDLADETARSYVAKNAPNATASVTFPDAETVTVSASTTVHYTFGKLLGLTNSQVAASASAAAGRIGEALDYVLYSGSTSDALQLNGSNQFIDGDVHTNKNFAANGSKLTVTGVCEAVTTIDTNGSLINIAQRYPGATFVPMPDFAESIKLKAQEAGTYSVGNKSYNGSQITLDSPIYVEGNLEINGSRFTGRGTIVATGDITFNGSNLRGDAFDALAFYSREGDITINGSHANVEGILYAPEGEIRMNGSNQTVHGRVVGYRVTFNGSQLTIDGNTNDLKALPTTSLKLVR